MSPFHPLRSYLYWHTQITSEEFKLLVLACLIAACWIVWEVR